MPRQALFGWAFNPVTRDQALAKKVSAALDWASSQCNFWSDDMRPGRGGVRVVATASVIANCGRSQKSARKIGL